MKLLITALIRNVFFSSVSFFIVGLIGLLIVPLIIKSYGVSAYGLIVFSRTFLPSGLLGIFDCGVMEVATKISARISAVSDNHEEKKALAAVILLGGIAGVVLAVAVAALSPYLPELLAGTDGLQRTQSAGLLLTTASVLVLLFPGLVVEGIARGQENFLLVRATEILSSIFYAVFVLVAIHLDLPFEWVAYAFLLAGILKVAILGAWVLRRAPIAKSDFARVRWADLSTVFRRGLLFAQNKILGTVQTQLPVMLIGFISGPVGSAVYDVVMRLPRFFKSILGLTMSVVFPASARLDANADKTVLHKLVVSGLGMVMLFYYPLITACIVFSEKIMAVWVDTGLVGYWPWMALMFAALLTNVLLSYALTIGSVRESVQKQVNMLFLYQAVFQFAVSFALINWQAERAFIIGQALAMLVFFPVQMRTLLKNLEIKNAKLTGAMLRHASITLVLTALYVFVVPPTDDRSIVWLLALGGSWVLAYLALTYVVVLDAQMRKHVKTLVLALRPY